LQSIISGGVNEVGTITPVQDFKNMLTRKDVDLVDTGKYYHIWLLVTCQPHQDLNPIIPLVVGD